MKTKKNNLNKNKQVDISNEDESIKPKNITHTNKIYNGLGITYFIGMLIIIGFMFTQGSNKLDTTSIILFVGFFVFMSILGFKLKMKKNDILIKPIKMFIMIVGVIYIFEFIATGINTFGLINANSFDVYDIKKSHSNLLTLNNNDIYFKSDSSDLYIVNKNTEVNGVEKFTVYKEDEFDKEILQSSSQFYDLSEKVKFSYIIGNVDNEIILQITDNNQRYLAKIKATGIVESLKTNSNFGELIYKTNDFSLIVNYELNLIGYFGKNTLSINEFDKIKTINDTNYLDRGFAFLSNHYTDEYIESENMSIELMSENVVNNNKINKINLYSIRAQSSDGFYGITNVIEVIFKDESSIIGMIPINYNLMKEGVQIEE